MSRDGAWRRQRLASAHLYVVTDARVAQGDLAGFLDAVLRGGADIVQLRDKEHEAADLLRAAAVFHQAAQRHDALFFINDRPDVALAADADGVHLGQNDLAAAAARRILGIDSLIGWSTHSREQFDSAPADADYLCAGPVYETPTKPGRPATGVELIRFAASRERHGVERRPWFAIGGLDTTTLPAAVKAGARRAVVVRAADGTDPEASVRALRTLVLGERL